jgi:hypothetical protein
MSFSRADQVHRLHLSNVPVERDESVGRASLEIWEIEHVKLDRVAKIKTIVPALTRRRVKGVLRSPVIQ